MWSMLPEVLLQIIQLGVRSPSTGSFVKEVNLFELVVFVAGDFTLPCVCCCNDSRCRDFQGVVCRARRGKVKSVPGLLWVIKRLS